MKKVQKGCNLYIIVTILIDSDTNQLPSSSSTMLIRTKRSNLYRYVLLGRGKYTCIIFITFVDSVYTVFLPTICIYIYMIMLTTIISAPNSGPNYIQVCPTRSTGLPITINNRHKQQS